MTDSNPFEPIYSRFDFSKVIEEQKPLLAHYTTVATLEQILKSNQIWFSNPLFMNDLEEVRRGMIEGGSQFEILNASMLATGDEALAKTLRSEFEMFYRNFLNNEAFNIYILCLSEHDRSNDDGILSMWRAYGGQGNGVAIVFDTADMPKSDNHNFYLAKVSYQNHSERTAAISGLIVEWARIVKIHEMKTHEHIQWAAFALLQMLKISALTSKHIGFSEEREWRVIYLPDGDKGGAYEDSLGYFIGDRGIEPKLKLQVDKLKLDGGEFSVWPFVRKVILGPSLASPIAIAGVSRMLDKLNFPQLKSLLQPSSIPLRPTN